ncbi:hypothetical protein [Demequina litorisediminis]|uniref:hypothetical protein n=1 Tax=Demequina litorisediminis TaxID=1849022 RepID=UPI0024E04E60|nr:hypothetical protein [Demequina litorisediminis]
MRLSVATVERERLDWVDAATDGLPPRWRQVVADTVEDAESLGHEIEQSLEEAAWPSVEPPQGWRALFAKATLASSARKKTLEAGRAAVRAVVLPRVVEPTETIHQAYRAMDEPHRGSTPRPRRTSDRHHPYRRRARRGQHGGGDRPVARRCRDGRRDPAHHAHEAARVGRAAWPCGPPRAGG